MYLLNPRVEPVIFLNPEKGSQRMVMRECNRELKLYVIPRLKWSPSPGHGWAVGKGIPINQLKGIGKRKYEFVLKRSSLVLINLISFYSINSPFSKYVFNIFFIFSNALARWLILFFSLDVISAKVIS